MRKLIAWGIMATAAICIAVLLLRAPRQHPPASSAAASPAVSPEGSGAQNMGASAARDPKDLSATEKDRLAAGPKTREFTAEQKARLDALQKQFGELQSKIAICQQEQGDIRVASMGQPRIQAAVDRFKAARVELEKLMAATPARAAADTQVREANGALAIARNAQALFDAHRTAHLTDGPDAHKDCGWCHRDAARMRVKDAALAGVYAKEAARIEAALSEAEQGVLTANTAATKALREASAGPDLAALHGRVREAQSALNAELEKVPELVESKRSEDAAMAEQKKIAGEIAAIYAEGRVIEASVVASRPDAGAAKAQ